MALAMVLYIIHYLVLITQDGIALMMISPALYGTALVCFWMPYNFFIVGTSDNESRDSVTGVYFFVWAVIASVLPIVGAASSTGSGTQPSSSSAPPSWESIAS